MSQTVSLPFNTPWTLGLVRRPTYLVNGREVPADVIDVTCFDDEERKFLLVPPHHER